VCQGFGDERTELPDSFEKRKKCCSGFALRRTLRTVTGMSSQPSTPASRNRSRLMESFCEMLPNCTRAISLAETGAERPLKSGERLALRYHSRLCPFCGCAQGKFDIAMEQMRTAEAERSSAS
jgi:hypothetical protein